MGRRLGMRDYKSLPLTYVHQTKAKKDEVVVKRDRERVRVREGKVRVGEDRCPLFISRYLRYSVLSQN